MMLRSILYLLVLSPAASVLGRNLYETDTSLRDDAAGSFGTDHSYHHHYRHYQKQKQKQQQCRKFQTVVEPTLVQGETPIGSANVDTAARPTDSANTPSAVAVGSPGEADANAPKFLDQTLRASPSPSPQYKISFKRPITATFYYECIEVTWAKIFPFLCIHLPYWLCFLFAPRDHSMPSWERTLINVVYPCVIFTLALSTALVAFILSC